VRLLIVDDAGWPVLDDGDGGAYDPGTRTG
jgi:hypothetical protein